MSDFNGNNNVPSDPTVPSIDKPDFEVPPQPAQAEQPEFQSTNYQPINLTTGMPPKKSKKKLVGIISAIVGVAACACVAVFAGPKIIAALSNSSKDAPIDRLKNSITASSKELSDSVLKQKDQIAKNQTQSRSTNMKLNVTLGDSVMSMIPAEYAGLNNSTININTVGYEKQCYFDLDLTTPVATAATMKAFVNLDDSSVYFQIPELSDSYLSTAVDTTDMPTMGSTPTLSAEDFAALITDETKTFLDTVKDVEYKEDVSVEAAGIEAKYDLVSVKMSGSEFADTVYNCYERLTKESFIKEVFDLYAVESGVTIDDSLAELKTWTASNKDGVTLGFYLDNKDKIKGLTIIPENDDSNTEIGFLTATDKSTGFDFYGKENNEKVFSIDGSYTESKDVYNGKATFTSYKDGMADTTIDVDFKDVSAKDNTSKGTYTISSPALNGLTISINTDCKEASGTIGVNLAMATMDMATITIDYTTEEATSCPSIPADAIVYDAQTESQDYLSTADMAGFMTNFQTATGIDISSLLSNGMDY